MQLVNPVGDNATFGFLDDDAAYHVAQCVNDDVVAASQQLGMDALAEHALDVLPVGRCELVEDAAEVDVVLNEETCIAVQGL